ncbi:glyoxalase superfamily protein [Devosia sp. LjRoot16]|uniref:glyoxalase superfamily protein n=1 Tax=Devosia sp. LjRoot16 TaxID=3342271 RepID=UPI003ED03591
MHSFLDAKQMARALRQGLADRQLELSHSDCLELVALQFGFADWNRLAARINAEAQPPALPAGWTLTGIGRGNAYRAGLDPDLPGAMHVASTSPNDIVDVDEFGGLMRTIPAAPWRGKTVRLGAELMGKAVERGAIWLKLDAADGRPINVANNPARGDFGWTGSEVVMAVPETAALIRYGLQLAGGGEIWARGFRLEEVVPTVA